MKDEATPEMIALARRCAAKYWQTGDPSDEAAARSILSGEWDDQAYTQAALAAIIETQENIAEWLVSKDEGAMVGYTPKLLAKQLRAGHHYGKDVG